MCILKHLQIGRKPNLSFGFAGNAINVYFAGADTDTDGETSLSLTHTHTHSFTGLNFLKEIIRTAAADSK